MYPYNPKAACRLFARVDFSHSALSPPTPPNTVAHPMSAFIVNNANVYNRGRITRV